MILISCIDDRGGLLFHGRRLSRDRVLCQDVLRTCAGSPLWMAPGSRSLFSSLRDGLSSSILTSEDFLAQAAPGEFCFLEDRPIRPFLDRVESMVLYHWNRRYPADLFLDLDPAALGWSLLGREEFPGSSHKKITKEVLLGKAGLVVLEHHIGFAGEGRDVLQRERGLKALAAAGQRRAEQQEEGDEMERTYFHGR